MGDDPRSGAPPAGAERGTPAPRIGILASQGDFAAHVRMLTALGADAGEVRTPEEVERLDGLVIPGGESTTIMKAIARDGLEPAIRGHVDAGRPLLGTCAGLIVADREHLALIDVRARRNAFGRQLQSFEVEIEVEGIGPDPLRAVFIRAPWVEEHGSGVDVLARHDGKPTVVREGSVLACAFHPELTQDSRLHALFMAMVSERGRAGDASPAGRAGALR